MSILQSLGWTIVEWQNAYKTQQIELTDIIAWVQAFDTEDTAWISIATPNILQQQIDELEKHSAESTALFEQFPLYGIPFAVKDNIDVVGFASTAGCMLLKDIVTEDAETIRLLKQAGAIVVGKTNLDQFATGLVGTRSPFGAVPNSFNPDYVSGGSSSGSASVVARGLVPFSLGTDTAG
ncbi:allophanate hydrolase, partial [Acinetobacter sp. ANC 4910]|uniref:amidase family protein n=1 Tax=Acinetobacter sp. ANC 4910 TaxID=2529850 RepID=UPI0010E3B89D